MANFSRVVYLVRHPETEVSQGICYGNSDVLPTQEQLHAALMKVKVSLKDFIPGIVYSSPLTRCTMLAEKLAGEKEIIVDELIREVNFGKWEMVPWANIPKNEHEIWGSDFINNKIHGGESFIDVQNRVISFWNKIILPEHREIVVVAHAGVFRTLLLWLLKASPEKIFAIEIGYGDVIRIQWDSADYYKIKFL